jgi:DNA invertase Pin-like site-specific DNA recombinase
MSTPVKAVAYYRMSTDKQEASIPRQRESVQAYAKVNGYEIVREYKDEGISGDATERRTAFLQMREDGARGDFRVILCWDKDRFGRFDSIEQGYWVKPLRDAGVRLVTVTLGPIDWTSFGGRIADAALAETKHEVLLCRSRDTLAGKIRVAKGAYFNGGTVPYGFDRLLIDERDQPQKRLRRGQQTDRPHSWHCVLVPSEIAEEVETVRWLFRSFADRDVSCRTLADELNARSIPGPGSIEHRRVTKWGRQGVKDILENPHYVGDHVWGKAGQGKYYRLVAGVSTEASDVARTKTGKPRKLWNTDGLINHRDAHEGLIDRALWDRVQAKLAARRREQTFPRGVGYTLAGLVRCGHCGKKMHGCTTHYWRKAGKVSIRRYVCTSYNREGTSSCEYHSIREDALLPFLIRKLQTDYLAPERLEQLREELRRQASETREGSPEKASSLRSKLAKLDAEIRQGARNLLRAGPNIDLVSEALTELRGRRDKLAKELDAVERALSKPAAEVEQMVDRAVAVLYHLRERIHEARPDHLREVLRQMVTSIELYFEGRPSKERTYHRLVKGVLKLRPQLDVSGIKECQSSSLMPTSTTLTACPPCWSASPSAR